MRDIAEAAKVHTSTVSLALRGSPKLPKETRDRIKAVAESLGYTPDPYVSSLMAQRRRQESGRRAALAFITAWDEPDAWRRASPSYETLFNAAMARAESFGFALVPFWVHPPQVSSKGLERMLEARGIRGLIIAPLSRKSPRIKLNAIQLSWERFATVAIGYTIESQRLNRVAHDYFQGIVTLMRKIFSSGYKRPILVLEQGIDRVVGHTWHAGYMMEYVGQRGEMAPAPISFSRGGAGLKLALEGSKADALICLHAGQIATMLSNLGLGRRAPALFSLDHKQSDSGHPGIHQRWRKLGELAAESVIDQMQRGEYGLPEVPRTVTIAGSWLEA